MAEETRNPSGREAAAGRAQLPARQWAWLLLAAAGLAAAVFLIVLIWRHEAPLRAVPRPPAETAAAPGPARVAPAPGDEEQARRQAEAVARQILAAAAEAAEAPALECLNREGLLLQTWPVCACLAEAVLAAVAERPPPAASPVDRASPHGTLDWQFAFSDRTAQDLLAAWTEGLGPTAELGLIELRRLVDRSLDLDRWLILSYVLGLTALCLLAGPAFPAAKRLPWLFVCCLPLLAGALDWFENGLLDRQLDLFERAAPIEAAAPPVVQEALPTSVAATLKLGLLATTLLALILVGFAWLASRGAVSRTRKRFEQDQVIAAERSYLDRRRELLGLELPTEDGQGRPPDFGLALSGGGLRSATINLGALQALARHRLLPRFDYLSTVSGGGYIGSAASSLLSINRSRISEAGKGKKEQYAFAPGDEPWFSTAAERFPFDPANEATLRTEGGFGGGSQMRHLRAAGKFLVGKTQPLSVEMLRVVGEVLGGIVYHLIHFGLLLVVAAAGILWAWYLMIGGWATREGPRDLLLGADHPAAPLPLFEQYKVFAKKAFGFFWEEPWWTHPFFISALVGFAAMAIILVVWPHLLKRLRADWFPGADDPSASSRNRVAVFAMGASMFPGLFVVLITWFSIQDREALLNISVPLFGFLGGGLCLGIAHGWVRIRHKFSRPDRSRLAAQEGAFVYLTLASLFLVLLMLPFVVFFEPLMDYLTDRPIRSLLGWLLTLLGARAFARGEAEAGGKGMLGRLLGLFPGLRRLLLSTVVVLAVVGALLQICVWIWRWEPLAWSGWTRLGVALVALALYVSSGWLDFNRLALNFFYRDRLAEAYLVTSEPDGGPGDSLRALRNAENIRLQDLHGRLDRGPVSECVTTAPYHLVVTCLNLTGASQHDRQATRKTDQFIFSKLFCGSESCGFLPTDKYRRGKTQLARAMAISGAAASPAMGQRTFFAQSAAMALFNVRLGQWMENPSWDDGTDPKRTFWPPYLLREVVASSAADSRLVYLSDGGHSGDNLGIYPLLRRRCRLILAIDAEQDPACSGNSLVEALRQIKIDEGVEVDLDLGPLRPRPVDGCSAAHYVTGRIRYPDGEPGWLFVLKSTLTGDEPEMIANYKRSHEAFPHESTGDLFFDDAQFEAYRQLGDHLVETLFESSELCRGELPPLPQREEPRLPGPGA